MAVMTSWTINSLEELDLAAGEVLDRAVAAGGSDGTVLALSGDLGAGKTTFVQTLAKRLDIRETVTSPTFVIMKQYGALGSFEKLVHIDAYRIESVDEMPVLGFEEILEEKGTIICIEWAERIKELLPNNTMYLKFSFENDERTLTLE